MTYKKHKCKRLLKRNLNKIVISKAFEAHPPKKEKYNKKLLDFIRYKKLDPIIVDENFVLDDGYCTYLMATGEFENTCKPKIYKAKGLKVGKEKNK